ncbi:hypothetical protein AeMF1_014681 [Aphanomyces euteiches]|nr:hypothetical protein AeMF1_014681 [Aphanomyces euteiches]KAH9181977.1 hypothetical protein AeNC1_016045 [Aphanomyces euteiches]
MADTPKTPRTMKGANSSSKSIDALTKKRLYNMNRNRMFRKLEADERARLRAQLSALEAQYAQLKKSHSEFSMWKDVAALMESQRKLSEFQTKQLQATVKKNDSIVRILSEWNKRSTTKLSQGCLMAHGTARQLALDWIAKRLLFHIDEFTSAVPLPSDSTELEPYNGSYRLTQWHQRVEFGTVEAIATAAHEVHLDPLQLHEQEVLEKPRRGMEYVRRPAIYGRMRPSLGEYAENVLVCVLQRTAKRVVVCSHSITYDGAREVDRMVRDWTKWTVIEYLDEVNCRVMDLLIASGLRQDGMYVPLDVEDASVARVDDLAMKWNLFQQSMIHFYRATADQEVKTMRHGVQRTTFSI